jgi:hypothetical protein
VGEAPLGVGVEVEPVIPLPAAAQAAGLAAALVAVIPPRSLDAVEEAALVEVVVAAPEADSLARAAVASTVEESR